MAISRYVTLFSVRHAGVDFPAGTPMALSDELAAPLLAIKAIQAQAGALPTMPAVKGPAVTSSIDSATGQPTDEYLKVVKSDGRAGFSVGVPVISLFPDFSKSIMASYVAGTTASQAGNTVTVTGTSMGIVGNSSKDGYRIYYPGSANIPAGWYSGFVYVDANTITFQRAVSAVVAAESVGGGVAFTSQLTVANTIIQPSALGKNGRCRITARSSGGTGGTKTTRILLANTAIGVSTVTTQPSNTFTYTFFNVGSENSQIGGQTADGGSSISDYATNIDTSIAQPLAVAGQLSSPAMWRAFDYLDVEIVKNG